MTYGVIYKITNSINNKIYYGQTRAKQPISRWNRHKYSTNKGCTVPIHSAMRLHGIENFKFEIVFYCDSLDELNSKEIEVIFTDNTICPNGYNIMKGGDNYEKTTEHKQKISNSLKGKHKSAEHINNIKLSLIGKNKIRTPEHNIKIGLAHSGKKKPTLSDEHKSKIVKSLTGRKHSPETIEKMRNSRKLYWEKIKLFGSSHF